MPWTAEKPPSVAANWTADEKRRCVTAANAVLTDGGTDEEAIYACIHAAGRSKDMSEEKATWSAAVINDLPDSSFLYVEPGGTKDEQGKTTPRSKRHLPYKDGTGKVDLPHLRNAISRLGQPATGGGPERWLTESLRQRLLSKARGLLEKAGGGGGEPEKATDLVIAWGDALKALGDGRIAGIAVRFTGPHDKDLEGEWFGADTYYGARQGDGADVCVHHRFPLKQGYEQYARKFLQPARATRQGDVGILAETILNMADEYEKMLYTMVEQGKLAWSSAAPAHLVDKDPATGKITSWPIAEFSLTPTPAEPRNRVMALKAYMAEATMARDPEQEGAVEAAPQRVAEAPRLKTQNKSSAHMGGDGGNKMDVFKVGSQWMVYETDDGGEKTGDPVKAFDTREAADTYLSDQRKPDWQRAVESLAQAQTKQTGEILKAVMVGREGAGEQGGYYIDPNKAYAEPKPKPTWESFLLALHANNTKALEAMGAIYRRFEKDAAKDLGEGTGATGGFLVPAPLSSDFYRIDPETEVVWPRARVWPMTSRTLSFPALDMTGSTAGKSNYFGGFYPEWNEHGTDKPETEPSFRQIKLESHEMSAYTEVQEQLLKHSIVQLASFLQQLGRDAVMFYTDEAFIDGNGVGQPLGIIPANATITVPRAGAGAVVYADLVDMLTALLPSSMNNAVWIINHTVLEELLTLVDPLGNYVWQPNARDGINWPLFGRPIVWTEKNPALGTAGDVILADCRHYYIGRDGDVVIAVSEHYRFRYNLVAYKIVVYVDGQPALSQPVYLKDGATQVSPFVILGDVST